MRQGLLVFMVLFAAMKAFGQNEGLDALPRKGSYLYYGQPAFEDNSFLLTEAINQEKGMMQYVSNFYFDNSRGGNLLYSFTHEIPISSERHQLSYSLFYYFQRTSGSGASGGGFGDINLSYNFLASGKKAWAMVVPSFTLIVPSGKSGYGSGGLGGQLNVYVTKRISHKVVTHYNFGYTFISQADLYISTITGNQELGYERDLQYKVIGASVIWYPARKFNLLTEVVSNFLNDINADGSVATRNQLTLNPGFRFAIDHNRIQIVPGASLPIIFADGKYSRVGLFFYLSFEPQYLPFSKAKSR